MSQEQKFEMMTEAPIPGLIGRLAVPTIISMLITSFYNMADTFFVGKIGTSATAAVGVVFPVMAIIRPWDFSAVTAPATPSPGIWAPRTSSPPGSWLPPDSSWPSPWGSF